jgi:2,4-dichlorophenol 6-monooxygenase
MELFREIGFADAVYEQGAPLENMRRVGWYTSLGGSGPLDRRTIALMDAFGGGSLQADYEKNSPCRATNYPQLRLEPLMCDHATRLPHADLHYHHELVSFSQDEDGVLATILNRGSGTTYQVRAQYMIAADGGKKVGPDLGIAMEGAPRIIDMMSAHIEANLAPWIDDDTPMIRWYNNPDQVGGTWGSGVMVAMGPESYDRNSKEWLVHFAFQPGDPQQFDQDSIIPRLRTLFKLPDLEMRVLRMNNWQVQGVLAEKFRDGRIFLLGDAAHRHPPTTGLGLNSAIADAHNLAWKLAGVLQGRASDALLDSYEDERRAVTGDNVAWALFTFQNHLAIDAGIGLIPGAPMEMNKGAFELLFSDTPIGAARRQRLAEIIATQRIEFQAQRIELGYHYTSGAVIPDGAEPPVESPMGNEYIQTARPGHRFPHFWVLRGGERISSLDLLGKGGFTLFVGEPAAEWSALAGPNLRVAQFGPGGLQSAEADWLDLCGLEPGGMVLVRPDGHVGWRSRTRPANAAGAARDALQAILKMQLT